KDDTGAVIVAAKVKLTDQATNQSREQNTNAEGIFEFRALPRGEYTIEAEQTGFKKQVIANILLQVAQTQNLQVTLQVGGVTESIEVQATAGLLQASEASLSQVIDEKRVLELPINGRNLMQLVPLSAGVITAGRASATERQANYGSAFSVGGQRDNTSVVLVDGMEISGQELNNYPLAIPSLDSVAEFRVQTSNYSAEFGGNSGAIINVASKRGSNELHATLFEFLRNNDLDARNFFSSGTAPLKRNQFGFSASGPVFIPKLYNGKNKTFWMFSYEVTRQRQAVSSTALVPSLAERAGDFSGVNSPGLQIVDPLSKTPFPNNVIPQSRINPIGSALAKLYPVPNSPDPARNYVATPGGLTDNNVPALRIDHQLSSRDALWGRFTENSPLNVGVGSALSAAFPGFDQVQDDNNLQFALGDIHTFSPTIVNEANVGYVRFRRERHSQDSGKINWVQQLGIKGYAVDPLAWAAPSVTPTGYNEIGYSLNNAVFKWLSQSDQIVDNLSIIRGAHTFKLGLTIQAKRQTSIQWGNPNGTYGFSGMFSAPVPVTTTTRFHSMADLLTGYPTTFNLQLNPFSVHDLYKNEGYYFQDDWKVTPTLTANIGMRWEYFGRPVDRHDQMASFDLNTGQQIFPGQNGVPRSLADQYYKNFAPRIGLAWRPRGNNRLTVRTAYGIFYTPEIIGSFRTDGFQDPNGRTYNLTVRPPDPKNPLPIFTVDNPLAQANLVIANNRAGIQRNFRDGQVQQWNVTTQYLITKDTVFELAYHGSKSSHLGSSLNYNQTNPYPAQPPAFKLIFPYPQYGSVSILESRAAANYNALQARLERRFVNGFTFLASYTFQKTLTDLDSTSVGIANGAGPTGPQTITDIRSNKGPTVFDRPHRLNVSALYELPFLKKRTDLLGKIAGGWQVGTISTFQDGAYLTPASYGVQFVGSRPNLLGNPNLSHGDRSINRWFDVSKLANPLPGQLGNAGKGTVLGSGNNKWDVVISKFFRFTERQRLEFRAELFNAFNHPQFDDPVIAPANNPTAGKITSASDFGYAQTERVIQFGLKFDF
ncbi:MAG TPA: carboxypeptidase regulatory-like domain-containing protein, partial [Bryobacterales bacterium]|nr:carboxypeptidase regulatory-like domain-containing protein [Bryobacterales bacterium]